MPANRAMTTITSAKTAPTTTTVLRVTRRRLFVSGQPPGSAWRYKITVFEAEAKRGAGPATMWPAPRRRPGVGEPMMASGARDLSPLMKPRSIAVLGASQRMSRATRVVRNLQTFGYAGRIFPINPKYDEILGLPCFPDLASTPEPAESVVVGIPAEQVPSVRTAAVQSGVRGRRALQRVRRGGIGGTGAPGRARAPRRRPR